MQKHLQIHRHHNCRYTATKLLDIATDAMVCGLSCLDHMNALKTDPGYKLLKDLNRAPDERTVRYLLGQFDSDEVEALRRINLPSWNSKPGPNRSGRCGWTLMIP